MSTRLDPPGMNDDARLATALRRLPQHAPPTDLFPRLAARARRRARTRRARRYALPAAVAASLALAVLLWPRVTMHEQAPVTTTRASPAASATMQLVALRRHSQDLQEWVHQLDAEAPPLSAAALADVAEIEDRIALVDLQLGAADDAAMQAALWRQRIALLRQLGMWRLSPNVLAAASTDMTGGAPAPIWIH